MNGWRWISGLVFLAGVALVLIGGSVLASASAGPVQTKPSPTGTGTVHKVTLCHATDSETNPYVVITVDIASAGDAQSAGGHAGHTGPIFQPGMKAQHIKWGDIIPPYTFGAFHFPGLNATGQGLAILAHGCHVPPAVTPTPTSTPPPTPTPTPSTAPPSPTPTPTPSTAPPSPTPTPSPTPSASPSPSASASPSASPSPTPTGGAAGAVAGPSPSPAAVGGGVPLAETGGTPGQFLGLILIAIGLMVMGTVLVAARKEA